MVLVFDNILFLVTHLKFSHSFSTHVNANPCFLLSLAPPYATSVPDDVAVRVGEVIRLQCLAHGTPPLTYIWTKLDGSLPLRAEVNGGDLQINLATAEDAGSYKCVASNKVGNSEVIAKVAVRCEFADGAVMI